MGAKIIEKHLTINKNLNGPDHKASLDPKEFKSMVQSIRNTEKAIGKMLKKITTSEKKNIFICRKSIVAKTKIKKGEVFSNKNLTTKRPAGGINPMKWLSILGKKSKKNYNENEFIKN